jgi:hypothetical protein
LQFEKTLGKIKLSTERKNTIRTLTLVFSLSVFCSLQAMAIETPDENVTACTNGLVRGGIETDNLLLVQTEVNGPQLPGMKSHSRYYMSLDPAGVQLLRAERETTGTWHLRYMFGGEDKKYDIKDLELPHQERLYDPYGLTPDLIENGTTLTVDWKSGVSNGSNLHLSESKFLKAKETLALMRNIIINNQVPENSQVQLKKIWERLDLKQLTANYQTELVRRQRDLDKAEHPENYKRRNTERNRQQTVLTQEQSDSNKAWLEAQKAKFETWKKRNEPTPANRLRQIAETIDSLKERLVSLSACDEFKHDRTIISRARKVRTQLNAVIATLEQSNPTVKALETPDASAVRDGH